MWGLKGGGGKRGGGGGAEGWRGVREVPAGKERRRGAASIDAVPQVVSGVGDVRDHGPVVQPGVAEQAVFRGRKEADRDNHPVLDLRGAPAVAVVL